MKNSSLNSHYICKHNTSIQGNFGQLFPIKNFFFNFLYIFFILFSYLKQILRNPRNCSDQKLKMSSEGLFECFLSIFDLENTILGLFPGVFKSRFGYRGPGSNFKSHSYILNCISDCSARRAESIGANIFRIRPSYHKLRLKTVQKCQKYGVLNRKVNFSHLFLDITSQFFHTIICKSCSF